MGYLFSLVVFFFFFEGLRKKPFKPLLIISLSLIVSLLGLLYQEFQPPSKHFLPFDDTFVLVKERTIKSRYDYIRIYGTNKTPQQIENYFRKLVHKKTFKERLLSYLPGGDMLNYKKINQYGEKGYVLLILQYAQGDSVSVSVNTPPVYERQMTFPTELYIEYNLQTLNYRSIIYYLEFFSLILFLGLIWFLLGLAFAKIRIKK